MSSSGAKGQPCPGRHGGIPVKVDNDGEVTMIKNFFVRSASIAAIAALAPVAAVYAQVTTSNVRGVVTDSAGQPVAGASVAIVQITLDDVGVDVGRIGIWIGLGSPL